MGVEPVLERVDGRDPAEEIDDTFELQVLVLA